mmetsp:Transcript_123293/g.307905  ORF Transcript_123293/g.307905 Transcript_123293/m.307905 type:complete len:239 (+) Transcript_123293:599-1315(+)
MAHMVESGRRAETLVCRKLSQRQSPPPFGLLFPPGARLAFCIHAASSPCWSGHDARADYEVAFDFSSCLLGVPADLWLVALHVQHLLHRLLQARVCHPWHLHLGGEVWASELCATWQRSFSCCRPHVVRLSAVPRCHPPRTRSARSSVGTSVAVVCSRRGRHWRRQRRGSCGAEDGLGGGSNGHYRASAACVGAEHGRLHEVCYDALRARLCPLIIRHLLARLGLHLVDLGAVGQRMQ